jgi:signal transduction histidine kinase
MADFRTAGHGPEPGPDGHALVAAEELERRRVGRELHDDIGQGLALLAIGIDRLGRDPPETPADLAARAGELSAQVRELSSAVHALSHQLHPAVLERAGLVAALRGLCRDMGRHHGLEIRFSHAGVPEEIAPAAALCLYRVAQEALRNVVRHSGTDRVAVELAGTPAGVRLVVTDRGAGFDPAAAPSEGLGLVSMSERVRSAGGRLEIDAQTGGGTRIDARVPAL